MRNIVIIGIGLMGGSLAAALKKASFGKIIGVDKNHESIKFALDQNIIDIGYIDFKKAVTTADLIVLATPVMTIIDLIPQVGKIAKKDSIITDFGSTKEEILRAMEDLPETIEAIGGHPICGKFETGIKYSDAEIFKKKTFILSPLIRTKPQTIEVLKEMISVVGGVPLILSAPDHDRYISVSSHLPRLLPLALLTLIKNQNKDIWNLTGGNFKNMTHLSTNNPKMWLDILLTNKQYLTESIRALCIEMEKMADLIENSDQQLISQSLADASEEWEKHFS